MLPAVLLHVIETALPVDHTLDLFVLREPLHQVPHLGTLAFPHVEDGNAVEGTRVVRLAPGRRVERGAVQPYRRPTFAFPPVGDSRRELPRGRIRVVESLGDMLT